MSLVRIRTSERKDFKACPQRWWWSWREGLAPRFPRVGALWFGTGIHFALAEWYRLGTERGPNPLDTFKKWADGEYHELRTYDAFDEREFADSETLATHMLEDYLALYGTDEWMDVIATEETFEIEVPALMLKKRPFLYNGTWDLVYRDLRSGGIYLADHKTAAQISTKHLSLDDQAGSYLAFADAILQERGVLKKGEHIDGILYNFLRKSKRWDKPTNAKGQVLNKDGSVSKVQPAKRFHREVVWRNQKEKVIMTERLRREHAIMDQMRRHPELVFKTPGRDCSSFCPFFEMCEMHEQGGDHQGYKEEMYIVRDPYADHRKSAGDAGDTI